MVESKPKITTGGPHLVFAFSFFMFFRQEIVGGFTLNIQKYWKT